MNLRKFGPDHPGPKKYRFWQSPLRQARTMTSPDRDMSPNKTRLDHSLNGHVTIQNSLDEALKTCVAAFRRRCTGAARSSHPRGRGVPIPHQTRVGLARNKNSGDPDLSGTGRSHPRGDDFER
jgi:hypothetical protein